MADRSGTLTVDVSAGRGNSVFTETRIQECRDHPMNYYRGGPNTRIKPQFPPLPVVKKAGQYSWTKKSTALGGDFDDSVTQADYSDPSDYRGGAISKAKPYRAIKGGTTRSPKKNSKCTSQVAELIFNQGSIASGTDRFISKKTEMTSQYTGGRPNNRPGYLWEKNTHDGFRNFSTKQKPKLYRTGMSHPRANTGVTQNEKQHYTAVHGAGNGSEKPLSVARNGAGPRLGHGRILEGPSGQPARYEV
jgi:hypothetical protein